MPQFFPDNLVGWLGVTATVVGAIWAILTFHRNNRIKAAEILIDIEEEYGKHIPILLKLEHIGDYDKFYREALRKSVDGPSPQYTDRETKAINKLEAALRHFFVCASIRRLSVDGGAIDRLCAWYLRVLVTDLGDDGKFKRPELREYIRRFWPTIYFWAPLAPAPWPKRLLIVLGQTCERFQYWWTGSWAEPPRQNRTVATHVASQHDCAAITEQSHAVEPAAGQVLNRHPSPPAQ